MGSSIALMCEVHNENCIPDFCFASATGRPLDAFGACASHSLYIFVRVDPLDGVLLKLSCRPQPNALATSPYLEC